MTTPKTSDDMCVHPLGMTCPKCGGNSRVSHTRPSFRDRFIIRYRRCANPVCKVRFVSRETVIKFQK